jgi:dipeptidyl-peptidase-4
VGVVGVAGGTTTWFDLPKQDVEYVVRAQWLPDNSRVSVQTMNRQQTRLDLSFVDAATGRSTPVLTERDTAWVNVIDDLVFLKDGSGFLWGSERDGFQHLYMYRMDGTLVRKITDGPWSLRAAGGEVAWLAGGIVGVNEDEKTVYFTALEKSSIEKHLYAIRFDGSGMKRITNEEGTHSITFSPDAKAFVDRSSSASTPPALRVFDAGGKILNTLSSPTAGRLKQLNLAYPSFVTIPARDGFPMPAQIMKPAFMEPGRKYPVIFYVYSGPSAPVVSDSWQRDIFWDNLLVKNGYIVVSCDNRSATGISKTLENTILHQLAGYGELRDLVDAVQWVKRLPYVDSSRVGIWGWSGGGSCTLSAMTRSTEFKAGIAVAGVTDFRYYDSKFAEQFMKTELENKAGFETNNLVRTAKDLHGRLMIVHGTYDDNVHVQNTWAFVDELIKANKQFDMMIYPMRMHGIADRPARIHLYSTMLEFWKKNL